MAQSQMPERQKRSWEITLRWYLSFCRRGRVGVTVESARQFIAWAQRDKQAQAWRVEGWKEAINWFFRAAKNHVSGARCQASGDPRSKVERRHHVADWEFQRKIKDAATKARLNKRVTPHVLRHSFASQSLDGGMDIGVLKELLGHKSVETTMIYAHAMRKPGLGIRSPLDRSSQ